mgnify:CR=1 FL=1
MVEKEEQLKSLLENMDFDAEDLIRVVSALGQIKKKKDTLPEEKSKVIGDKTYGGIPKTNKKQTSIEQKIISQCKAFTRQALHSKTLSFVHPISKKKMHFVSDLPNDMRELINSIK